MQLPECWLVNQLYVTINVGNVSDIMYLSIKLNVLPLNSLQISLNVFQLDHPDKPNGIKSSNVFWLKI